MAEHATERNMKTVTIIIDCIEYQVNAGGVQAVKLREFANPPIGQDRDLFLEQPGDDRKLMPGDVIELVDGMVFYTAPCVINPGHGWRR